MNYYLKWNPNRPKNNNDLATQNFFFPSGYNIYE